MCAVSNVSGGFQQVWPDPQKFPPVWYPDYNELVRKAKLYDEMTKQKDCQDDDKAAWEKKLHQIMKEKYGLEPHGS